MNYLKYIFSKNRINPIFFFVDYINFKLVIKTISKYINLEKRRVFNTALLHLLWRFYHAIIRYSILYLALIIPSILVSKKALINKVYLEKVKEYFMEDWNKITTIKYKK